jgi:manganese/zinc/iron transport system permease protein
VPQLPTGATIALTACALFLLVLLFAPQRGAIAFAWRQFRLSLVVARDHALRAMIEDAERGATPRDWRRLAEEAGWSRLQRALLPAWFRRRGWVMATGGPALALSPKGLALGQDVTRRHRLWEHYMQAAGGLPPQAAHDAADEVEHALPQEVARDAEDWLRRHDPARLPQGAELPLPGEPKAGDAQ